MKSEGFLALHIAKGSITFKLGILRSWSEIKLLSLPLKVSKKRICSNKFVFYPQFVHSTHCYIAWQHRQNGKPENLYPNTKNTPQFTRFHDF